MQLTDKIGIDPSHFAKVNLTDFLKAFKGKVSEVRLREAHAECVETHKPKKKVVPKSSKETDPPKEEGKKTA